MDRSNVQWAPLLSVYKFTILSWQDYNRYSRYGLARLKAGYGPARSARDTPMAVSPRHVDWAIASTIVKLACFPFFFHGLSCELATDVKRF